MRIFLRRFSFPFFIPRANCLRPVKKKEKRKNMHFRSLVKHQGRIKEALPLRYYNACELCIIKTKDMKITDFICQNNISQIIHRRYMRMLRSVKKALDLIKTNDPNSSVTVYAIRRWCIEGKVKCLKNGKKLLVDMQSLLDYIAIK